MLYVVSKTLPVAVTNGGGKEEKERGEKYMGRDECSKL